MAVINFTKKKIKQRCSSKLEVFSSKMDKNKQRMKIVA